MFDSRRLSETQQGRGQLFARPVLWQFVLQFFCRMGRDASLLDWSSSSGALKRTLQKPWSATKNKTAVENAYGHFQKHGSEFPQYSNAPASNTFAAVGINGAIKTMFMPNPALHRYATNLGYFNAQ